MGSVFTGEKSRHVYEEMTICEVHRQLYDLIVLSEDFKYKDRVIDLLEMAYLMGIKLIDKLAEYKLEYQFKSPSAGPTENIDEVVRLRQLRIDLERKMANATGNRLRPAEQQTD